MTREEFESLISKYLSGQASAAEERLMEDFFAAQERKPPEGNDTISETMWASIEDRIANKNAVIKNASSGKRKGRLSNYRILVSACVALMVAMTLALFYHRGLFTAEPTKPQWISLHSPNGQKSIITLPDGSRIFLNAGSSISYPEVFLPEKREVKLSGEAFFEVAENPGQPFIVSTKKVTTKVLGTSFNVRSYPDREISVTVATGRVQVEAIGSSGPVAPDSAARNRVILMPNDQATFSPDGKEVTIAEVNIEDYLAWKDNTLLFDDTSLEEVAKILERWYNVTIVFDNEHIKTCRINGKYTDQSLENVLKSIQYMYNVDFVFSGQNKISLRGKGCRVKAINSS